MGTDILKQNWETKMGIVKRDKCEGTDRRFFPELVDRELEADKELVSDFFEPEGNDPFEEKDDEVFSLETEHDFNEV